MPLVILDDRGRKHLVPPGDAMVRIPGVGVLEASRLESSIGRRLELGGKSFLVLHASSRDLRETMDRGAQTLTPKDLAAVLYLADVIPGMHVAEAGAGSGGLTVALARSVGPSGRVYSYDNREEALAVARGNVERADLGRVVEFRSADVRRGFAERDLDAVILDLLDPWAAIGAAWDALRPCGHLGAFTPNMEQVKETVAAIRGRPFVEVRTIELIEREMEVRDVGVRPSFAALGHTGYLTFARKVLDTF
ncbi:MAG TPA: methyltransferase domain-containing protein [Thermoplasmata archaeon]|nr:methyltransferase domain-containing protein [Thermoplasmata archaeon]